MCLKQCATSCLDKSQIAKRVGNLTNKKMVYISLLDKKPLRKSNVPRV